MCQSSAGGKTLAEAMVGERFVFGAECAVHAAAEAAAGHPAASDVNLDPAVMWHLAGSRQDAEVTAQESYWTVQSEA